MRVNLGNTMLRENLQTRGHVSDSIYMKGPEQANHRRRQRWAGAGGVGVGDGVPSKLK